MSIETPVIPGIEWPEPVMTADLIIKNELADAISASHFFSEALHTDMQYKPKDPSLEA